MLTHVPTLVVSVRVNNIICSHTGCVSARVPHSERQTQKWGEREREGGGGGRGGGREREREREREIERCLQEGIGDGEGLVMVGGGADEQRERGVTDRIRSTLE